MTCKILKVKLRIIVIFYRSVLFLVFMRTFMRTFMRIFIIVIEVDIERVKIL